MTREEQTDWLCRLRANLNNGVIFTPWNKEFTEALTGILEQEPSGDLISRSALMDALKVHFDSCFREDGELLYSDHICTSDDVVDLIKLVENQPIAYDVDKVIEELDIARTFNDGLISEVIPFDIVVEILKAGVKNE